jgi:branched-chain amino acid transport system substrate-binding protein
MAVAAGAYARTDAAGPSATAAPTAASAISCSSPRIGIMAPITGPAASIGKEQRNWARYAVQRFNASPAAKRQGIRFSLREGDTRLDPKEASTVGQRFASDSTIAAVAGPAGSQEVHAVGPIFKRGGLPFISMSATADALTSPAGRYPTFFRVVARDSVQGVTDATFIKTNLKAGSVVAIDDQTSYGRPLADATARALRARQVDVSRESVPREQTDFSALVTNIDSDTDVVFLAWQIASNAQVFAQQMREQGKNATIFGSDGLFSPDFKIAGAYVSAFAPDIKSIPSSRAFVAGYRKQYGDFGTFGPPTYVAVQAAATAIAAACQNGSATRAEVLGLVKKTNLKGTILGRDISFDSKGDVRRPQFFIYRFTGGQLRYIRVR